MSAVFVPGVPDTHRVWSALLAPEGFDATDWQLGELARQSGPPSTSSATTGARCSWYAQDPFAAPRFGARLAERTGARFVSRVARTGG